MAAIQISTGHTLSRTVSGFVRAVKTAIGDDIVVPLCLVDTDPDPDNWYWEVQSDGKYSPSAHCSELDIGIGAAIFSTGGYSGKIIDLSLTLTPGYGWIDPPPTDPEECPAYYARGGFLDKEAWIKWGLSGMVFADAVLDTSEDPIEGYLVEPQPWSSVYGQCWDNDTYAPDYPPFDVEPEPPIGYGDSCPTEDVVYDESLSYSVSITGTFKLMADYPEDAAGSSDDIEGGYPYDLDPYGMTARKLQFYYVPTSGLTVTIMIGGVTVWTKTYEYDDFGTQDEYEAAFKNGFGRVTLTAEAQQTWSQPGIYPANTRVNMGEIARAVVSGMPNAGSCQVSYEKDFNTYDESTPPVLLYTDGHSSWTPSSNGGTLSLTTGNDYVVQQLRLDALSRDTTYSLTTTDYEGSARSGVEVKPNEFDGDLEDWEWDPINEKSPNVTLTTSGGTDSETVRSPGDIRGFDASILVTNRYYELQSTGDGAQLHCASDPLRYPPQLGVTNLDSLSEPKFPSTETESYFHDGRCEMYVPSSLAPGAHVEDAVRFTTPATLDKTIFATHTNWSVTSGTANINDNGTSIEVVCTTDANIFGDCSGYTFAGARYADLIFSQTGTDDTLTVGMGGCTWEVTETDTELDLASPLTGGTNPSTAQSRFGSEDWGWGVGTVGTMTITGLKAGKTYTFSKVTLKRKDAANPVKVVVFGGGFVGDVAGASRESDAYTMWAGQTRKALIYVDGMPAAEVKDTFHEYDVGEEKWLHTSSLLGDADALYPADGFVTMTPVSAAEELETAFLVPGIYSGVSVDVDTRLYGTVVSWPYNAGNLTLNIPKQFRGGIAVGVADLAGTSGANKSVNLYYGPSASGPWTLMRNYTTDAMGLFLSDSLQQSVVTGAKFYKAVAKNAEGEDVEAVVQVRNRNVSLVRLIDTFAAAETAGLASTQTPRAGRVYRATCVDGKIKLHVYDHTSKSSLERTGDTVSGALTGLGVAVLTGRKDSIAVVWDDGGTVYRNTSLDQGRTWGTKVSIASGTAPAVAYQGNTELLAYVSDSKATVKRKVGTAAWSSAITVSSGLTIDTVSLAPLQGERIGGWVLFAHETSGAIRRYKSTDNGRSWALDE